MSYLDEPTGAALRDELHRLPISYDPVHAQRMIEQAVRAAADSQGRRRRSGSRWWLPAIAAIAVLAITVIATTISGRSHGAANPTSNEPPSIARLSPRVLYLVQGFLTEFSGRYPGTTTSIAFVHTTVATAERNAEETWPIIHTRAQRRAADAPALLIVGHGTYSDAEDGTMLHGTVVTEVLRLKDGGLTDYSLGHTAPHLARFGHVTHISVTALAASPRSTWAGYRRCEVPTDRPGSPNPCLPADAPQFTAHLSVNGTPAGRGRIPVTIGQPITISLSITSHSRMGNLYLLINGYPWGMKTHHPAENVKILLHHASTLRSGHTITATWTPTVLFGTPSLGVSLQFDIGNTTAGVTPAELTLQP